MYAVTKDTAEAARKSENRTSFIDEKGKYLGRFTKAEQIKASTGTQGIAFSFKGHDGVLSNFSIYTIKSDGTQLGDFGLVISIMTVLGLRDIKPTKTRLTEWDRDQGGNVERDAVQFVDLLDKDIGTLFNMEEYEKKDSGGNGTGEYGWSAKLNAVFRESDELVASEILARKTTPEKLPQLIESLRDKPLKKKAGSTRPSGARGGSEGSNSNSGGGMGGYDDAPPFDDDIPF